LRARVEKVAQPVSELVTAAMVVVVESMALVVVTSVVAVVSAADSTTQVEVSSLEHTGAAVAVAVVVANGMQNASGLGGGGAPSCSINGAAFLPCDRWDLALPLRPFLGDATDDGGCAP
jgi:hypothetical protein